jgi:hypothetical protein
MYKVTYTINGVSCKMLVPEFALGRALELRGNDEN